MVICRQRSVGSYIVTVSKMEEEGIRSSTKDEAKVRKTAQHVRCVGAGARVCIML